MNTILETDVRLFASSRTWIEDEAVRQFYRTAQLDGMRFAAAFPDLHPGRLTPVGAAFVSDSIIYPHVIGADIGCGVALFATDLARPGARHLDGWAELRFGLEHPWDGSVSDLLAEAGLDPTPFDEALGTIGGGNHFAELQAVESVIDAPTFRRLGLRWENLVVLVHSGSRGLGESILGNYTKAPRDRGVPANSDAGAEYLRDHDRAVRWARANRALIAKRFAAALRTETTLIWDGCHNSIAQRPSLRSRRREAQMSRANGEMKTSKSNEDRWVEVVPHWIHRKGAVEAHEHPVVIPGSRGSSSYLAKPMSNGEGRAWSLAHGAARKCPRSPGRLRM